MNELTLSPCVPQRPCGWFVLPALSPRYDAPADSDNPTGLTVPFALTAGLSSLGSSKLVVTAGIAELVSGALSMGVGGYLSAQAERDHYRYLKKQTRVRYASLSMSGCIQSSRVEIAGTSDAILRR